LRVRQTILYIPLLTVLVSSAAVAGIWMPCDKYLAVRRQCNALIGASAQQPGVSQQNRVVEIQGTVGGVAKCGSSSTFIVNSGDQSIVLACFDPDPQIQSGNTVRMLARPKGADLEAFAAAWDYEVTEREKKAIAQEKKLKTAKASSYRAYVRRPPLASRWMDVLEPYKRAIAGYNRKLSPREVDTIATCILEYSERYDLDPRLVVAVVIAESNFKINATSRTGAMGLGQLMPGTAAGLGVSNAYDPNQNLAGAVRLIRGHLDKLSGGARWSQLNWDHLALALASYNAGSGAVRKYHGIPPYKETRNYIARVITIYKTLCGYK
jgi:soluble lytic murein transglycosylase-like protein